MESSVQSRLVPANSSSSSRPPATSSASDSSAATVPSASQSRMLRPQVNVTTKSAAHAANGKTNGNGNGNGNGNPMNSSSSSITTGSSSFTAAFLRSGQATLAPGNGTPTPKTTTTTTTTTTWKAPERGPPLPMTLPPTSANAANAPPLPPPMGAPPTPPSLALGFARAAHQSLLQDDPLLPKPMEIVPWRMKERMKTMDVALVLCLNIGTDPPDVVKSSPCARKECWVDPFSMPAQKALETIGKTLQSQYERWQPRARYRQSLDPTVEETKTLCVSLRRHAKHDRVLFHYNGHGVPRPTQNGEIWVFNKSYTQYIPLLVYDLQSWVGTPSIYVFDCSAAGVLLSHFNTAAATSSSSTDAGHAGSSSASATSGASESDAGSTPGGPRPGENSPGRVAQSVSQSNEAIVLAACAANELLPMNPELCADVFTSCLTTPITVALRWFLSQNELSMNHLDAGFIERIPGKLTDRKTPLGELNWIFTAITDTIAWNVLPKELFQKLFRQDLLVASLFRNFLLAERIMKSAGCSPCSLPALPPTHYHPLWRSWDLAAEICLSQLYKISNPHPLPGVSLQPSRFFAEQLTAFEVWLQFGSNNKPPPQQLPMVLQVLLSQVHRLRALVLLKKFLDLGPWAVNLALSVGIFPYVLKLLQSPASELRQVLVFIWAKILALDSTCQVDLVKDEGHAYFIAHLAAGIQPLGSHGHGHGHGHSSASNTTSNYHHNHLSNPSMAISAEQKVMAAFILSMICNNYPQGQLKCLTQYLHKICCSFLMDSSSEVRKWICLCLAKLWENYEDAKRIVTEDKVPRLVSMCLHDDEPQVRAAAAFALGTLVGRQLEYVDPQDVSSVERMTKIAQVDILVAMELLSGCQDASPLVRKESVLALANLFLHPYHQPKFECVAKHFKNRSINKRSLMGGPTASSSTSANSTVTAPGSMDVSLSTSNDQPPNAFGFDIPIDAELHALLGEDATYYAQIWHTLKEIQSRDPFPKVVNAVKIIVSRVNTGVLASEQDHLRNSGATSGTGNSNLGPNGNLMSSSLGKEDTSLPPPSKVARESSMPGGLAGTTNNGGDMMQYTTRSKANSIGDDQTPTNSNALSANSINNTMRPTQSVGNFRLYQENFQDKTGAGQQQQQQQHGLLGNPIDASPSANATERDQDGNSVVAPTRSAQSDMDLRPNGVDASRSFNSLMYGSTRQVDFPASLRSNYYEYCKADFNLPMLEPVRDDDDPLSEKGAARLERVRWYERVRQSARKLAPPVATSPSATGLDDPLLQRYNSLPPASASSVYGPNSSSTHALRSLGEQDAVKRFTMKIRQCAVLNNEAEMTSLLLFHPYESMLVVADEKDQISMWNFEQSERILTFGNKNPTGSRLTSLGWINESEEGLLTCGSDDGVIKIYQGLHTIHPSSTAPNLLTAFVAVPDLVPGTRGSGLVTNWQQDASLLFAGGNSSMLRAWNLSQEQCVCTLSTQTDSCITSMGSDESTSNVLVAGFGDGSLRLFDARSRPDYALKTTMKEHTSWVVQTYVYSNRQVLVSGSVSGEIKFWDLRYPKMSTRTLEAHRSPMTALAVHEYAPVFASGSHNQFIKVFRSDGEQLALIRHHEGFLGERIGPVSCLAFHPHRLVLAAGATDSLIAIYSSEK